MSKTLFFVRKKSMGYIEEKLVNQEGFELCYKKKNERIFRNKELLITCKNKYVSALIYDDTKMIENLSLFF